MNSTTFSSYAEPRYVWKRKLDQEEEYDGCSFLILMTFDLVLPPLPQLQDAVPMTVGQEFHGWSATLGKDIVQMHELAKLFSEVNLGGTAIGTGINTDPNYTAIVLKKLAQVTGIDVKTSTSLIEATSDMGDFILFSGLLRRLAVKLSKIANDLRLLSSGPRGGFNDINLPAMQPGSSIMPGKVNPVIPEAVNQTAFQVIGNDLAITLAAEAGQLQLNAMEPLIIYNLLLSLRMLTNACHMFTERCIRGITVNKNRCEMLVRDSIGIVTAFSPFIGYEKSSNIAKKALLTGRSVVDLIKEEEWLDEAKIESIMKPENLTGPSSLISEQKIKDLDKSYTHLRESTVMSMDFLDKVFSSPPKKDDKE
jgi:aspartate ammonia-lyase